MAGGSLWGLSALLLVYLSLSEVRAQDISQRLGTKTPYRFVANENLDFGPYPGCTANKIWMILRHGTRYPNDDVITFMQRTLPLMRDQIIKNRQAGKTQLTEQQIAEFEKWKPTDVLPINEKILTTEGREEMFQLAKRTQARFPDLLPNVYSNGTFIFMHTPVERTEESAKQFAHAILGDNTKNVAFIRTAKDDPVLRFYKSCRLWKQTVKKNPATYAELTAYSKSPEVMTVLQNISVIFGFDNETSFSVGKFIYSTCAYETAWTKDYRSPWCFPFSDPQMQILEYSEDLKYYWVNGYGFELSRRIGCTLLNDVIRFFSDPTVQEKAAFHFTHSGTILMTLAHLGLYEDTVPLAHNSRDMNRKWFSSKLDAFGANIGFVSYKCGEEEKILLMHQERVIRFPECPNDDLCPLSTILQHRETTMKACNLRQFCTATRDEF